jgi:hypothetical protein
VHTDRCDNTSGQKCYATGSRKDTKIQEFMYRGTMNVKCEMYDYAGNNWKHWISNKRFKEKFGSQSRKAFDSLQKAAMLGISHIKRKVLQSEN